MQPRPSADTFSPPFPSSLSSIISPLDFKLDFGFGDYTPACRPTARRAAKRYTKPRRWVTISPDGFRLFRVQAGLWRSATAGTSYARPRWASIFSARGRGGCGAKASRRRAAARRARPDAAGTSGTGGRSSAPDGYARSRRSAFISRSRSPSCSFFSGGADDLARAPALRARLRGLRRARRRVARVEAFGIARGRAPLQRREQARRSRRARGDRQGRSQAGEAARLRSARTRRQARLPD